MEIDNYNICFIFYGFNTFAYCIKGAVNGIHINSAERVYDSYFFAAGFFYKTTFAGSSFGQIYGAYHREAAVHKPSCLRLCKAMITQSYNIYAAIYKFFGFVCGDSVTGGGIFAVGNNKIHIIILF